MPRRYHTDPSTLARAWFPAALILLLLLAIPGLLLLLVGLPATLPLSSGLLGGESGAKDWLERTFGIAFHAALPLWAGLVLLLIPLLLVLLYFLKLKRKPLHVPSTFLWKKSIEDLH